MRHPPSTRVSSANCGSNRTSDGDGAAEAGNDGPPAAWYNAFAEISRRAAETVGRIPVTMTETERAAAIASFIETEEGSRLRDTYNAAREHEYEALVSRPR